MQLLWNTFGGVVPIYILIATIIVAIFFLMANKKGTRISPLLPRIFLVLTFMGILSITLYPTYSPGLVINTVPFKSIHSDFFYSVDLWVPFRNVLMNIVLFTLLGFFLGVNLKKKSLWRIIIIGCLFSICIEITQYILPIGRVANVDDVILNTIGTFIGGVCYKLFIPIIIKTKGRKE